MNTSLPQGIAGLGGLVIRYVTSLGLVPLLGVAALGAGLTFAHSPTLGWVGALCGSVAVHAFRRFMGTQRTLVDLVILALILAVLCAPPLWVVLS